LNKPNLLAVIILVLCGCSPTPYKADSPNVLGGNATEAPLKLWFDAPASQWDNGIPIGNGRLGAMVHGTPEAEILTLNEDTVWSGQKRFDRDRENASDWIEPIRELLFAGDYHTANELAQEHLLSDRHESGTYAYQMLGKLHLASPALRGATNYSRELDLKTAIAVTRFESEGVEYKREYFVSAPDQTLVMKITASQGGQIDLTLRLDRAKTAKTTVRGAQLHMASHVGDGVGVQAHAVVNVEPVGGEFLAGDDEIIVRKADSVIIKMTAGTDYYGEEPEAKAMHAMRQSDEYSYAELKERHVADYQGLFNRVSLDLNAADVELPTDARLQKVIDGGVDHGLTEIMYQFGRYLFISSSRPGNMPANLQGIWADGLKPIWNSDYHININIQMNYWMAEMVNLGELHEPFLTYIDGLRELGRISAKNLYNAGGFVAHHTSDGWFATAPFGKARAGMWPMGGAWAAQHLFTHYEYTLDDDYLRERAYPILKEAAEFFVDYMVEDPRTGYLITGPSTSPENSFLTGNGDVAHVSTSPTMDRSIVTELYSNTIRSAEILDIDHDFADLLRQKLARIQPLEVGPDGRLMEWEFPFEDALPGHRHISHLYALHPSNQITRYKTPELFDAAEKTIEHRLSFGGGHTSWSRAWIINFYARLADAERSYENVIALQRKSTRCLCKAMQVR